MGELRKVADRLRRHFRLEKKMGEKKENPKLFKMTCTPNGTEARKRGSEQGMLWPVSEMGLV